MSAAADLVARLESPVPAALPAGVASAVFCYGTCFHRSERIQTLELVADGVPHRAAATAMARPDVAGIPRRSGFWGTVPVTARGDAVVLELAVRLHGGEALRAPLARMPVAAPVPAPTAAGAPIAVCMATYEPQPELFARQVASLRAQTETDWVCVISDDASSAAAFARIGAEVAGDERFTVSRAPRRLGFYRNFERALALAPAGAELIALCDQDDVWHPDKLATLRAALGGAGMVYSDQRLVDAGGRVLRDTLWRGRRNNHADLVSLLVANSVTGAAVLMRRDLAALALPFPDTPGLQFHDHWLGLVALAAGEVAYVDRPLYDYVQHAGAVFGDVTASGRRGRRGGGRGAYLLGYQARAVAAEVLLARAGDRMAPAKRRGLRRFLAADRKLGALAWLALRTARTRGTTLGSELALVRGLLWRRSAARLGRDASFPPPLAFEQRRLRDWRARIR